MRQEDWASKIRDRLADYEEPAPDGLWDDIEKLLPVPDSGRKALVALWRLRVAAAVAALLIVGVGGYRLAFHDRVKPAAAVMEAGRPFVVRHGSGDATTDTVEKIVADTRRIVAHKLGTTVPAHVGNAVTEETVKADDAGSGSANNRPGYDRMQDNTQCQDNKDARMADKHDGQRYMAAVTGRNRHSGEGGKFAASLYASNIMNSGISSSNGVMMTANMVKMYEMNDVGGNDMCSKRVPVFLNNYKEEVRHHLPVTLGLSVSYSFTDRIWLESGVVYTKLSSDYTRKMDTSTLTDRQTLHYIGVPVRAGYSVWSRGGLSAYAVAGVEADFNVKARMETENVVRNIDKDRVQLSLSASAGVQYDFLPNLGIYIEPGAKYYIDNGSNVDNIFKDKKLNFSLQFGLRYGLNK